MTAEHNDFRRANALGIDEDENDAECAPRHDAPWSRAICIGIGEAGIKAINHMVALGIDGVNAIIVHTDEESSRHSHTVRKLILAKACASGKTGRRSGRKVAEDNSDSLYRALDCNDMVFIVPDMRDSTAVGIASVVARIASRRSQVTLGIAIRPFPFEDAQGRTARASEKALASCVASLIVVPGKLVTARRKAPDEDESRVLHDQVNELCRVAVKGLYDGIGKGLYADPADPDPIQPVWYDYHGLLGEKTVLLGIGAASGKGRAAAAVLRAFSNPLLATWNDLRGLNKILVNITAGANACLSYQDVREAIGLVSQHVDSDAWIVYAVSTDDTLEEEFRIALLAEASTGQ